MGIQPTPISSHLELFFDADYGVDPDQLALRDQAVGLLDNVIAFETEIVIEAPEPRKPRTKPKPKIRGQKDD